MGDARDASKRLLALIAQGEHQQQDFKYKVEDAPKLARSVSAFANTDGGRLLIGVRDDGSIHGVRSEEEIFMMHAAACKYCTPEPVIKFETLHVPTLPHGGNTRTVVICTVLPSQQRPIFALGDERKTAYVRMADENLVASPVHLAVWRQESHLRGEAFRDTSQERTLLTLLNAHPEGLTLNRLIRLAVHQVPQAARQLPRPLAITLLARFVRFGLVQMVRRDQHWIFCPER